MNTLNFKFKIIGISVLLFSILSYATCKYSFKDTSPIPEEVKTFRVNYLENKAQYVNTQLSPQLTERLKAKIINTTRLRQTNDDDAHYDISGFVSQYFTTTVSILGNNAHKTNANLGIHGLSSSLRNFPKNRRASS